ncbi:2-hydroxyacid dehydrogenase [Fictibacillus iocasae]|uniref:2-hydroxyacid dehydrogenase n=1 Tax=Fictibacillus iocasae TaxID=2715437 RepID=A0ABW2NN06_9BACL
MSKPYVYVTRKLPEHTLTKLADIAEIGMWDSEDTAVPRDVLIKEARRADGLLVMLSDKLDDEILRSPSLKIAANLAVGYDNMDTAAAERHGVVITNTPDVLTDTTADLVFALILSSARRVVEAAQYVKNGDWKSWSPLLLAGADVHRKTIGIFGMGRIGEAVARRAKGFDMNVLYHNRTRKEITETLVGVRYAALDELLQHSDFVVNLAPLTKETTKMFGKEVFLKMKKSAFFINGGRGGSVDEDALLHALQQKEIAGAGLDVYEVEPIDPNHPLLTMKNVTALPHIGSSTIETRCAMARLAAENIALVLTGKAAKTPILLRSE